MVENGISLTPKTKVCLSFSATLAALVMSVSLMPFATFASVLVEQGAMIIASTPNEPEAGPAPRS